jgi:glutamyl-tRNA synthetase
VRAKTLVEMAQAAGFYFQAPTAYDPKAARKWFKPGAADLLGRIRALVAELEPDDEEGMEAAFQRLADDLTGGKLGKVAQPLRLALTGTTVSPPIFTVVAVLGRDDTLARIDRALSTLDPPA